MPFTEIVPFDESGRAFDECTYIPNSWRGAMAVWRIIEERYLPPYYPEYAEQSTPEEFERVWGRPPTRLVTFDETALQSLWDVPFDKSVPFCDRIVMATTLDGVIVRRNELPRVVEAFRAFGGETSLLEQTDVLEGYLETPGVSAVAWNQTSVNVNRWTNY